MVEIELIKKHIESCMISYHDSWNNLDDMHSRLDELFLLWGSLKNQSFVKTVEEFDLNYQDFSDRIHDKTVYQIYLKFKEHFDAMDGYCVKDDLNTGGSE